MTRTELDLTEAFQVAAGSVRGRVHSLSGKNNQDAFALFHGREAVIGVVADGCTSGSHSEVGAQVGARLAVRVLRRELPAFCRGAPRWDVVEKRLLGRVRLVALALGEDPRAVVEEYLLFTLVGMILTSWWSYLFSLGDGAVFLNGRELMLGPAESNRPTYLAYGVLPGRGSEPGFREWARVRTSEVGSALVGTDGVADLSKCENRPIPGRKEAVGPLSRFWEDDGIFRNPDGLRRKLTLIGRDAVRRELCGGGIRREAGLLPDDTTLLVVRRTPAPGRANDVGAS